MKLLRSILIGYCCLCSLIGYAQNDARRTIEKGNEFYNKKEFSKAAAQYKHACMLDSLSFDAWYNFGNALYELNKNILSTEAYKKALTLTNNKDDKAAILHNFGNITCREKKYSDAIKWYKQALLLNPKDEDTRYNLAYAQEKLKQEEKDKEDKQKDDKKNENQPKPSKFAEECYKKSLALAAQYKFKEAYLTMLEGNKKDETVALYYEYTQKISGILKIIEENKQ